MNDYLVTYDGGQDVWADDLSFMQNSLKSMIDTAVRTYGDNYILWGCLDAAKENVVEGGVVISGKLYQVPALGAIGSNKLCFRKVLSDERTFENQQVHKVKKKYEAYLSTDTSGAVAWIDLKTASKADSRIEALEKTVQSNKSDADGKYSSLQSSLSESNSKIPVVIKSTRVEDATENGTFKCVYIYIDNVINSNDLISLGIFLTFNFRPYWLNCIFPAKEMPESSDEPYDVFAGNKQVGVGYDSSNKRIKIIDRSDSANFSHQDEAKIFIIKG